MAAVNEIPTEIGTKHIEFGLDGSKKMPELLGFYLFCLLFLSWVILHFALLYALLHIAYSLLLLPCYCSFGETRGSKMNSCVDAGGVSGAGVLAAFSAAAASAMRITSPMNPSCEGSLPTATPFVGG